MWIDFPKLAEYLFIQLPSKSLVYLPASATTFFSDVRNGDCRPIHILYAFLLLYVFVIIYSIFDRITSKAGSVVRRRFDHNPEHILDLSVVSGDNVDLVYEEMFSHEAPHCCYLKHGVVLPTQKTRAPPALVVDVGANVGLFGVAMQRLSQKREAHYKEFASGGSALTAAAASSSSSASPVRATKARAGSASPKKNNNAKKAAAASATPAVVKPTPTTAAATGNNNAVAVPLTRVVAFEPIPETFECARRNIEEGVFAETNKAYPQYASRVYQLGIGQKHEEVEFHYDPTLTMGASMVQGDLNKAVFKDIPRLVGAALMDLPTATWQCNKYNPSLITRLRTATVATICRAWGKLFLIPVLKWVFLILSIPLLFALALKRLCSAPVARQITAEIETLPRALEKIGLGDPSVPITFLKVDTEGAEEQVLMGIDDVTWARVHQCVVEVHQTPDDRLGRLTKLLRSKGFTQITLDEEDLEFHRLAGLKSIFATRG